MTKQNRYMDFHDDEGCSVLVFLTWVLCLDRQQWRLATSCHSIFVTVCVSRRKGGPDYTNRDKESTLKLNWLPKCPKLFFTSACVLIKVQLPVIINKYWTRWNMVTQANQSLYSGGSRTLHYILLCRLWTTTIAIDLLSRSWHTTKLVWVCLLFETEKLKKVVKGRVLAKFYQWGPMKYLYTIGYTYWNSPIPFVVHCSTKARIPSNDVKYNVFYFNLLL